MPLEDVIRLITEQADVDVVMSPNVKGEATIKLTDVTLEEALRSILEGTRIRLRRWRSHHSHSAPRGDAVGPRTADHAGD